jgi:hypothetical protein
MAREFPEIIGPIPVLARHFATAGFHFRSLGKHFSGIRNPIDIWKIIDIDAPWFSIFRGRNSTGSA